MAVWVRNTSWGPCPVPATKLRHSSMQVLPGPGKGTEATGSMQCEITLQNWGPCSVFSSSAALAVYSRARIPSGGSQMCTAAPPAALSGSKCYCNLRTSATIVTYYWWRFTQPDPHNLLLLQMYVTINSINKCSVIETWEHIFFKIKSLFAHFKTRHQSFIVLSTIPK